MFGNLACAGVYAKRARARPAPLLAGSNGRLRFFKDFEALQSDALAQAPAMGSVLVKGSRFMRMERLVQSLQALAQQEGVSHAA